MGGFRSAMLLLLVTPELIQGGFGPLREAHGGEAVSSVELARAPPRAAPERPQRPVFEAPPRVYLGESPRAAHYDASHEAVVLYPPGGPLFEYVPPSGPCGLVSAAPLQAGFDAFGWRLHPFTMYFVPKAGNDPYADSSSASSRRAKRARMIPASNSTQVGNASSSWEMTSGGVSSMPTMKQTTMM